MSHNEHSENIFGVGQNARLPPTQRGHSKKKKTKQKRELKKKKKNKSGCFVWQRVGMDHHTEPCNSFLTRQLIVWERLFCSFICVKMGFSYSLWTQKAIVWKPNRKKNKTTTIRAYLTKGWKKNVVLAGPQYENEGGNQPRQKVTAKKKKREVVVRPYVYIYW